MIFETVVVGPMQVNCYIVASSKSKRALVIDPGADFEKISKTIKDKGLVVDKVVITHGHYDHIGALRQFNLPIHIHSSDAEFLNDPQKNLSSFFGINDELDLDLQILEDADTITVDDLTFEVIHTPGHTPGGICLHIDDLLFSGDTLFAGGVGRTDLPDASDEQLMESLQKLFLLEDEVRVFPGHGPSSTIGVEKKTNPFL